MADPGGSKASREQRDKIGGISGGHSFRQGGTDAGGSKASREQQRTIGSISGGDEVGSGRHGEDVGGERGKGG